MCVSNFSWPFAPWNSKKDWISSGPRGEARRSAKRGRYAARVILYNDLTPPERALWDAFPEGRRVDLRVGTPEDDHVTGGGEWGADRTVRGAVIVALLLGANAAQPGAVACLRLAGARIAGHLRLAGAQFEYALWIEECWFEAAVDLLGASAQTIVMTGCRVPGIEADSAQIEGNLDLRRSVVESLDSSPFNDISTALSLSDAKVAGGMQLNGAHLSAPGGLAMAAGGLAMGGGIYCNRGFVARGEIRLVGAQLPRGLYMRGSHLHDPGPHGVALALNNAVVSRLDFSDGFTANGTVQLRSTQISDRVGFEGGTLNGSPDDDAPALLCRLMQAVDVDLTLARPPTGAVDLRGAQVSYLYDSEQSWPTVVQLEGFVYGSIKKVESGERRDCVNHRLAWIRRSPAYSPQPYEQLASWYRTIGHDDDARRILLAKQRHRRRAMPWPARVGATCSTRPSVTATVLGWPGSGFLRWPCWAPWPSVRSLRHR